MIIFYYIPKGNISYITGSCICTVCWKDYFNKLRFNRKNHKY